jgi:hypothetical protein
MRHFVNDTITRQAKPLQWQRMSMLLCRAFGQALLGQWHFHLELIKRSIHSKKLAIFLFLVMCYGQRFFG